MIILKTFKERKRKMEGVRIGKVKWFKAKEGYGFVIDEETGKEYFFHYTAIESDKEYKRLYPDWYVRFTIGENEKGKCATWIKSAPDIFNTKKVNDEK